MFDFPPWVETFYKIGLTVNAAITIPAHIFMIFLATFRTPKEMKSYRFTVVNTTIWSLLFIVHSLCFFRPMPLFPLPAAKVCGILANLGDYYGGHVQFMIMVTLVFNVTVAAVLCFLNLYICVVHIKFYRDIQLRHGLSIYLICHILATTISIYVVHNAYTPTNELRQEILNTYLNDTYLRNFLYQEKDFVIFGFNPNLSTYTLILINLSRVICIAIWIIVPACLAHMFWYLHKLNKTPDNMLNFKKRIVRMLLTRASAPMLTGFLPTALCFIVAQIWPDQSFIVGNILLVLVFSHGFWICISTIVIFQPFKEAAKEIFTKPKIFFTHSSGVQKQNVNNVALVSPCDFSRVTNITNRRIHVSPISADKFQNISNN